MNDITPDICDHFSQQVTLLTLPLNSYGQRRVFHGEIVTVRCYHDNSKVKEVLAQDGRGKVLVVDGNGSIQKALLGDRIAQIAVDQGWQGIIINGAVRDVAQLAEMDIGIMALARNPFKTEKRDQGEINVTLTIQNQLIQPKDYLYADLNGVLITKQPLDIEAIGIEI